MLHVCARACVHVYVALSRVTGQCGVCDVCVCGFVLHSPHTLLTLTSHYLPSCCSRNNGYAISTPTSENYRGDGIGRNCSH